VDLIERATELKAVEHLRPDALTKQQVEGFLGKKLRGQEQGPIGKPQAIEDHPRHGFARCDVLLFIRHEAGVNHRYQAEVFDDLGKEPSMVQAFHSDQCHCRSSPASHWIVEIFRGG